MTIPSIAYLLSKAAFVISLLLSLYSTGALIYSSARKKTATGIARYTECFNAGKDARNIALVFLAVLFFVTSKAVKIGDLTLMAAITDLAQLYANGMIAVLIFAFGATVVSRVQKNGDPNVKDLCKNSRRTAIISIVIGLLLAYVCGGH